MQAVQNAGVIGGQGRAILSPPAATEGVDAFLTGTGQREQRVTQTGDVTVSVQLGRLNGHLVQLFHRRRGCVVADFGQNVLVIEHLDNHGGQRHAVQVVVQGVGGQSLSGVSARYVVTVGVGLVVQRLNQAIVGVVDDILIGDLDDIGGFRAGQRNDNLLLIGNAQAFDLDLVLAGIVGSDGGLIGSGLITGVGIPERDFGLFAGGLSRCGRSRSGVSSRGCGRGTAAACGQRAHHHRCSHNGGQLFFHVKSSFRFGLYFRRPSFCQRPLRGSGRLLTFVLVSASFLVDKTRISYFFLDFNRFLITNYFSCK